MWFVSALIKSVKVIAFLLLGIARSYSNIKSSLRQTQKIYKGNTVPITGLMITSSLFSLWFFETSISVKLRLASN